MEQPLLPLAKPGQLEPETIAMLHENPGEISLAEALSFNADIMLRKMGLDPENLPEDSLS
ncbi:hypothetical protein C0580_01915 [Candidatus Parcubacteria bacterium]|nr:MAG: hypothetical protein C0580_01915 [Candidatus Parcubacteria bacterium]